MLSASRLLQVPGRGVVYVSGVCRRSSGIADTYKAFRDDIHVGGLLAEVRRQDLIRTIVGRELSDETAQISQPSESSG